MSKQGLYKNCLSCGGVYSKLGYARSKKSWSASKFCSSRCRANSLIGKKQTKEHRAKLSAAKKGKIPANLAYIQHDKDIRKKAAIAISGDKYWNWKGGYQNTIRLNHERVMQMKRNGGSHKRSDWEKLKGKYSFMCLCCKKYEPEIKLTKDHITPVSSGGRNDIDNIQPLCMECNRNKGRCTTRYITEL